MAADSSWEQGRQRPMRGVLVALAAAGALVLLGLVGRGGVLHDNPELEVTEEPPGELDDPLPGRPPDEVAQPAGGPERAWAPMAPAPFSQRVNAPPVWTGTELVVWTGDPEQRGGIYDPAADRWQTLPPAPAERVVGWSAAWTGSEAFYWGGVDPDGRTPAEGAAFTPTGRTWRAVPPAPIPGRMAPSVVWADGVVVVWGGERPRGIEGERLFSTGALYDPASDTWSALAPGPLSGRTGTVAAWTGTHVLLWGGSNGRRWLNDGALYDPASDSWQALDPLPVEFTFAPAVAWTGAQLLVWGLPAEGLHLRSGWVLDLATREWSTLPRLLNQERASAAAAWLDGPAPDSTGVANGEPLLAVWGGLERLLQDGRTDGFLLNPVSGMWRQLPPVELSPRLRPAVGWAGDRLLVWGGAWRTRAFSDGAVYRP